MNENKIALIGGTFDPPHLGHLNIANAAVEQLNLSKLILLPVGKPPHKEEEGLTSPEHRLAMAKLFTKMSSKFELSLYDFEKEGKCYTHETVEHFIEAKYLIIGEDSLYSFNTWVEPKKILNHIQLVCVPRPGSINKHRSIVPEHIRLKTTGINISSTDIRTGVAEGKVLLPSVEKYIKENKLYETFRLRNT